MNPTSLAQELAAAFDFEAAVSVPFRMQPGLRRLPPGARQLTPLAPGSRHQREKLAVLGAFAGQALVATEGFDPTDALHALASHAAAEHPAHWRWDAAQQCAQAPRLGLQWQRGQVRMIERGAFGHGDELLRCLQQLEEPWRLAGLMALTFAEDFAVFDARDGRIPWLAVCLPSGWAPEEKVGGSFAAVHAPVPEAGRVVAAAPWLARLAAAAPRWERFVWSITDHPRLHAHPRRLPTERWPQGQASPAWFRGERQTFIPVPHGQHAVFTILVDVRPLETVASLPGRAQRLHDALASMSPQVLAYRGLADARDALLAWLQARAQAC